MNEEHNQKASLPDPVPGEWPGTPGPPKPPEAVLVDAVARLSVHNDSTSVSETSTTNDTHTRSVFDDLPDQPEGLRRLRGLSGISIPSSTASTDNPFKNIGPFKANNALARSRGRIPRTGRGRIGLKPKANVIRIASSALNRSSSSCSTPELRRDAMSISHRIGLSSKKRIQGTLRSKRVEALRMEAAMDFINKSLPATPASMFSTPVEMYNPEHSRQPSSQPHQRPPLSPLSTNTSTRGGDDYPLTPIENDLAALAVIAALPEDARPETRLERSPNSAQTQLGRSGTIRLPTGSVLTVITPEQTAWQRARYIPGPIRLQRDQTQPLNHDLFGLASVTEPPSVIAAKNAASEDAEMDEIAEYFESFGFDPVSFELDRFWVNRPASIMSDRKSSILSDTGFSFLSSTASYTGSSVLLPPPVSPALSSTSKLSGSTTPRPIRRSAPPAAQKMGLRRLMMSATGIL